MRLKDTGSPRRLRGFSRGTRGRALTHRRETRTRTAAGGRSGLSRRRARLPRFKQRVPLARPPVAVNRFTLPAPPPRRVLSSETERTPLPFSRVRPLCAAAVVLRDHLPLRPPVKRRTLPHLSLYQYRFYVQQCTASFFLITKTAFRYVAYTRTALLSHKSKNKCGNVD